VRWVVLVADLDAKDRVAANESLFEFERILYVERITGDNLKLVLLGEGSTYMAGLTGFLEELGVEQGWVVASHTFDVEDGEASALLTAILEQRGS
jgi:hypothetical protein